MPTPIVSRRSFLQLLAAASAARIIVPAFTQPREPYVILGEDVSYVGLNLHPQPTFIGGARVTAIGAWDGVGYPVVLDDYGYRGPASMAHRFYDVDLCNFRREAPADFWHHQVNWDRYPNLHAFIREQRFGEPTSVMRARMAQAYLPREVRNWPSQLMPSAIGA